MSNNNKAGITQAQELYTTIKWNCLSIEDNQRNIFRKNHAEKEAGRIVPDIFLFFKVALEKIKVVFMLFSMYFDILQLGIQ